MKINLKNKYSILRASWKEENLSLKKIIDWKKTILFFYPKDNTPGCTTENKDFTELKKDFLELWYNIIWVSKDSLDSHKKFVEKYCLKNDLISDKDLILHKELWAFWEKNNYWKIIKWVIRSTFLVDEDWKILKDYRNIRAKWHALRILNELDS